MITYQEFLNKYNGKPCEVAGSANAKNQCVDLANAYIREVLGLPIVEWTNAVDFPKKCLPPNYEYILNSATGFPIQGDIIIWSSPDGIGHIGICDNATASKFTSFDQNWPVGSLCKLVNHTYTGTYKVVGWLRCKIKPVNSSDENMTEQEKIILDFIKERNLTEGQIRTAADWIRDDVVTVKDKQIKILQTRVTDLELSQKDLANRITALEAEIQANLKSVAKWQKECETANKALENANKTNQTLTEEKNSFKGLYEKARETIRTLDKMTAWQHIRHGINMLLVKK
jgi:prefoldin subunit 5